jgi:hypothetical protein
MKEDMSSNVSIGDVNYIKSVSIIGDIYRSALSTADAEMMSMTSSNIFEGEGMDEVALNSQLLLKNSKEKVRKNSENENQSFLDEKFPPYDRKLDSRGGELSFGVDMDDDQVISTAEGRVTSEKGTSMPIITVLSIFMPLYSCLRICI